MSELIRRMRTGLTANPDFDREAMQQGLFHHLRHPDLAEQPMPMSDYEQMRHQKMLDDLSYTHGRTGKNTHYPYHRDDSGHAGRVMPSDIHRFMQNSGDFYMKERPAPQGDFLK